MMIRRLWWLAGMVVLTGCLFKGKPKPPPPMETVETTRLRADSLWVAANDHFRHGRWSKTSKALDRALLIMDYADPRRSRGHFMMGEALFAQSNPLQAVREFRRVADENAADPLAPDALVRAGDAYADLWKRPELDPTYGETAMTTYREALERYPGTPAAQRASTRILTLQERFAEKEFKTAMFYFRLKAYDSAILSFRSLVATYPRTQIVPEALVKLVETYARLEYVEDLKETCEYIQRFFPDTYPRAQTRSCPPVDAGGN
jgi:outer membrane assembly lipoprotein YfiO